MSRLAVLFSLVFWPSAILLADSAVDHEMPVKSQRLSSSSDLAEFKELFSLIDSDLIEMSQNSRIVVQTTEAIGRMIAKMRDLEKSVKNRTQVSDGNLAVDATFRALEQLKSKFENFKDEHWSRFVIPNFEHFFFMRDKDLATVTKPEVLQKTLQDLVRARAKVGQCFDEKKKSYLNAGTCLKRLRVCASVGYESRDRELVALKLSPDLIVETHVLDQPEAAMTALGSRFDMTSDRATLLSEETFFFCKTAATFGAKFKAENLSFAAEVAQIFAQADTEEDKN